MHTPKLFIAIVTACLQLTGSAMAAGGGREALGIVGLSTVYPFSAVVAEQFEKWGKFKTSKMGYMGAKATGTEGYLTERVGLLYPMSAAA